MFKSGFWLNGFAVFLVFFMLLAVGCGLWPVSNGDNGNGAPDPDPTNGNSAPDNGEDNGTDTWDPGYDPDSNLPETITAQIHNLPQPLQPLFSFTLPEGHYSNAAVSPDGQLVIVWGNDPPGSQQLTTYWRIYDVASASYGPENDLPGLMWVYWNPDSSKILTYNMHADDDYYLIDAATNDWVLLENFDYTFALVHWDNSDEIAWRYGGHTGVLYNIDTQTLDEAPALISHIVHTPRGRFWVVHTPAATQMLVGETVTDFPPGSLLMNIFQTGYLVHELDSYQDINRLLLYPLDMATAPITADYNYDIYIGHSDYPPRDFVFCVVEYNNHFYYGTIGADLSVTLLGLHYSWDTVQEIRSTGNFLVVQQQGSQEIFVYEITLP